MEKRMTNAGLVILAVITTVLVVSALNPGGSTPGPAVAEPTVSTAVTSPPAKPASFAGARTAMARPVTISVLGDSTGNDVNEWVALWGQQLGKSRAVTIHRWDDKAGDWMDAKLLYGTSGDAVTIWNFSAPGRTAKYAVERIRQAAPVKPDLVIYNFGHNGAPEAAVPELANLSEVLKNKWQNLEQVVTIQNPETGARAEMQKGVRERIRRWANVAGVPTIDVAASFEAGDRPNELMRDDVHPNDAGSGVWARTVTAALS